MEEPDFTIFSQLYRDAYKRCFSQSLAQPLTETESKLFYQQVLEHTGLTVGWRSLKNYSQYVLNPNSEKPENPSIATLDTLARYVLKALYTNEVNRKNDEGHHPYWFLYRQQYLDKRPSAIKVKRLGIAGIATVVLVIVICTSTYLWHSLDKSVQVKEDFRDLSDNDLTNRGWQLMDKDAGYWAKRNIQPNALTLFTLDGDNWPDSSARPAIKNLLLREMPSGCLTMELQMAGLSPLAEWQQAGLLLMQDTSLNSPSIRISLAYNDLFGGYQRPKEVIIQAISSKGQGSKPEEFAHVPVLTLDSIAQKPVLLNNLKYSALRIEKQNGHYRFLYAGGNTTNSAFKEIAVKDFNFEPHYVAIFALKGRGTKGKVVPVQIKRFTLESIPCN